MASQGTIIQLLLPLCEGDMMICLLAAKMQCFHIALAKHLQNCIHWGTRIMFRAKPNIYIFNEPLHLRCSS